MSTEVMVRLPIVLFGLLLVPALEAHPGRDAKKPYLAAVRITQPGTYKIVVLDHGVPVPGIQIQDEFERQSSGNWTTPPTPPAGGLSEINVFDSSGDPIVSFYLHSETKAKSALSHVSSAPRRRYKGHLYSVGKAYSWYTDAPSSLQVLIQSPDGKPLQIGRRHRATTRDFQGRSALALPTVREGYRVYSETSKPVILGKTAIGKAGINNRLVTFETTPLMKVERCDYYSVVKGRLVYVKSKQIEHLGANRRVLNEPHHYTSVERKVLDIKNGVSFDTVTARDTKFTSY